jgi:hypothetical protein
MNEHELQAVLTRNWEANGLVIDGQRQCLVAWEVMTPSWRINNAKVFWAEPSIDFLVSDENMQLTAVELKTTIRGVKPCWQALVQVTHRAAALRETVSFERLQSAYNACRRTGTLRRIEKRDSIPSLAEHHRAFFGLETPVRFKLGEIRRCVAAREFGDSWAEVLREFNAVSASALPTRVCEELTSKAAQREVRRLCDTNQVSLAGLATPVTSLDVESFGSG